MTYAIARAGPDFALVGTESRCTFLSKDGSRVTAEYDLGGKLQPLPRGWVVSASVGDYGGLLRRHQVADLCASGATGEDAISEALRHSRERNAPDQLPGGPWDDQDDPEVRHLVAVEDDGTFAVGQFNADGRGVLGTGVTVLPSHGMQHLDDPEKYIEDQVAVAGRGESVREAVDAALASIRRVAALDDSVGGEAMVGAIYRGEDGEIMRGFGSGGS